VTVDSTTEVAVDDESAFIVAEVPGEPSRSEGAVDTAIRLLRLALVSDDPRDHPIARAERAAWCSDIGRMLREQSAGGQVPEDCIRGMRWAADFVDPQRDAANWYAADADRPARPTVVCLCGSTRFGEAFREANLRETVAGKIVLSIGCDLRSDHELWSGMDAEERDLLKDRLDTLHRRKIDLADEVLVLNVGGYIGQSTRGEINYARALGKPIRYLDPDAEQDRIAAAADRALEFLEDPS
jgi:hypothetical protein